MNARFEALEHEGKIERVPAGRVEVDRLHAVVARDLATAEDLRERNRDWAPAIAYNAMLQACLALMAAHGYRARGEAQHRTAIAFARLALPEHDRPGQASVGAFGAADVVGASESGEVRVLAVLAGRRCQG